MNLLFQKMFPKKLTKLFIKVQQSLHSLLGLPDYDLYKKHHAEKHPHLPLLSYKNFFQQRQKSCYENKKKFCC